MKYTPLYEQHARDASTILNLKGFARAMHYRGHAVEHRATREGVTLCDVSHMGELDFQGPDALALVQRLITNDAARLAIDQALYSVMCSAEGMVIDDLVCLRLAQDRFIWVVNVTKTDEDYEWAQRHARGMDVRVSNVSADTALLALQGPESREALQRITRADLSALKYYWLAQTVVSTRRAEVPCIISRTGYTGERGYEIMVQRDLAPWVWDELLHVARPLGIMGHGVAARESLRTEAGYLLNGNDMDGETDPFEAGLGWVVKLDKDFIGREALARIKSRPLRRKMVGLEVDGASTVRYGCRIYARGKEIGKVTSGPLPAEIAGRNLGLGYVAAEYSMTGTEIEIDIRGRRNKARVVGIPFRTRRVRDEPMVRTFSPYELRFSERHVWARPQADANDAIMLGFTDFGQRELGDILCLELPKVGDQVEKGAALARGDSYRRAFELVSPITGEVVAVNDALARHPSRINAYPYLAPGVLQLRVDSLDDCNALMRFEEYADLTRRLRQYDAWTRELRTT